MNAPFTKCGSCKYYAGYTVPMCTREDGKCKCEPVDVSYSTTESSFITKIEGLRIRKLTPRECGRS